VANVTSENFKKRATAQIRTRSNNLTGVAARFHKEETIIMFEEKMNPAIQEPKTMQNTGPMGKRTYTVDEIQDILGISQPTAYGLIKKNLFHSIRIGRNIRISKASFDAWLDNQI
jgi:excisionase family DNA binding protein